MPSGHSLTELLVALTTVGILLAIATPRIGPLCDRAAVRSATSELRTTLATARHMALLRSTTVAVILDPTRSTATLTIGPDTVLSRTLASDGGLAITLGGSRDTIRYGPTGRGYGATNSTITIARGYAVDTTWVSRLGRVRGKH